MFVKIFNPFDAYFKKDDLLINFNGCRVSNLEGISYPFQKKLENLLQVWWSQCFLRNIERKVALILICWYKLKIIERLNYGTLSNEFKCSTIINIVNDIIRVVKWIIYTPLARIIHVYSFIFLSNQIFLRSLHLVRLEQSINSCDVPAASLDRISLLLLSSIPHPFLVHHRLL